MDYKKHYNLIIERAKSRNLNGYCESHHIIPRCVGGTNSKENLVDLTPEEHYVAHQLLVKMHPNNNKLLYAANMMVAGRANMERNNKAYGWLRKKMSVAMSEMRKGKSSWIAGKENPTAKERMLKNNPMKKPEIAAKVAKKLTGRSPPNKITTQKVWFCEECEKQHICFDTVHNNKRFCNKSCAASWNNKHRILTK